MDRQELKDLIIKSEKVSIEDGKLFPKVFTYDDQGQVGVYVVELLESMNKQDVMKQVGSAISKVFNESKRTLEELFFVSDTVMAKVDLDKEYTGKELEIKEKLAKGEMRPSEVPDKYKSEFIREALVLTSSDKHAKLSMTVVPYVRVGKEIKFEEQQDKGGDFTDNILSAVWFGYIYPSSLSMKMEKL